MQCASCRALQRGSALRCWKCGIDLTEPFVPAAAGTGATAAAAPEVQSVAPTPDAAEPIGPPPRPWLVRTFDPRITKAELERAASLYGRVPWIEAYRKPAALGMLPVALAVSLVAEVLNQFLAPIGYGLAGDNPVYFRLLSVAFVLHYAPIGLVALAWFVYRGVTWAIALSGGILVVILGLLAVPLASAQLVGFSPIRLSIMAALYVEIVLLWKAWRVALARHEYVWRGRI